MRTGPFSSSKVIERLNACFVPVYAVNEEYRDRGSAPSGERAEYQRIYREALKAKLSTGTVHAYVLTPDGHPFDSLHVAQAAKVEELRAMLERAVAKLKTPEGAPLVRPAPQSVAPRAEADALVLHLTARTLLRMLRRHGYLASIQDGEDGAPLRWTLTAAGRCARSKALIRQR